MKVQTLFDSFWDFSVFPDLMDVCVMLIYLILLFIFAWRYQKRKVDKEPEYRYFFPGLVLKVVMAFAMCIVYTVVYNGGDTTAYYMAAEKVGGYLFENPPGYFKLITGEMNTVDFSASGFNIFYNWPFNADDSYVWMVIRITSIFTIAGFSNYFTTSLIVSVVSYVGVWKLFRLLNRILPGNTRWLAIAFLFLPSVTFWGSGILKDTYTYSALCWLIYCYYYLVLERKKVVLSFLGLFISLFIIVTIKPYIFIALLPGLFIWTFLHYIKEVKSVFLRFAFFPAIILVVFGLSIQFFFAFQTRMGTYSNLDNVLNKAVVMQQDLKADYYGGESFDIGNFDPSVSGVLSKVPQALMAGLFRPFIWESRNPMMMVSGLENLVIMFLFLYVILRNSPRRIYSYLRQNPYLIFAIVYAIFFCFAVGLTTSNFGSLVRYRIPGLPFFVSALLILYSFNRRTRKERKTQGVGRSNFRGLTVDQ